VAIDAVDVQRHHQRLQYRYPVTSTVGWWRVFSGQWHVLLMICYCLRIHDHNPPQSTRPRLLSVGPCPLWRQR